MLDIKDKILAVFKGLLTRHHAAFNGPVFCDLQSAVYTTNKLPLEQLRLDDVSPSCSIILAFLCFIDRF